MKISRFIKACRAGFTLAEASISMAVATGATAGCLIVFIFMVRSYIDTTLMRTSAGRASTAAERMVYGIATNGGLREACSNSVTASTLTNSGWTISFTNSTGSFSFQFSPTTHLITDQASKVICTNVLRSTLSNALSGCAFSISVTESNAGRIYTNTVATYVQYRN
jgi:hypothetical protein